LPTLAQQIVLGNQQSSNPINFKGFFLGNPYTDPNEGAKGKYDTWYGHQMVSWPTFHRWFTNCSNGETLERPDCLLAEADMIEEIGIDIDPYGLDFPKCHILLAGNQKLRFQKYVVRGTGHPIPKLYEKMLEKIDNYSKIMTSENLSQMVGDLNIPGYEPCEDNWMTVYLNLK